MLLSPGATVSVVQSSVSGDAFQLRAGDVLTVLDLHQSGDWARCRNKEGWEDYVATSNLQPVTTRGPQTPRRTPADKSLLRESSLATLLSPNCDFIKPMSPIDDVYDNNEVYFKIIKDTTGGDVLLVQAGDIVMEQPTTNYSSCNKFFAQSLRTKLVGWVLRDNVTEATSLEQKLWYFESMSREQSENLLRDPSLADGTYLVRKSVNAGGHVLSFKEGSDVRHRVINRTGTKFFAWVPYEFESIEQLVLAHSDGLSCEKHLSTPYDKSLALRRPAPSPPVPPSCHQGKSISESSA